MIPKFIFRFFHWLNDFMNHPLKVIGVCLAVAFVSLVLEGSLLQLWSLHRDSQDLNQRIGKIRDETKKLTMKIKRSKDPTFIELEARNRFDLANEGDLIFVFADEEDSLSPGDKAREN